MENRGFLPVLHPMLSQDISGDPVKVGGWFRGADGLSLFDLPADAIDGAIRQVVRAGAALPFEKLDELPANLDVALPGSFSIGVEGFKEAVEAARSQTHDRSPEG